LQFVTSIVFVVVISFACFLFTDFIGYRVVALLLLLAVSVVAILFDILPVLCTAILSALIWNFFFIPPIYTFHIGETEDFLMFTMYFVIALVNAVLTFKIREQEKKARDKEEKEKTIGLYNTLLNSLSHELRTPIATILGSVDTLLEEKEKISTSNQLALLREIEAASVRLNQQVENLLNMSRLETSMLKLHLDWCDANELIFSVVRKLEMTNNTHSIVFDPNEQLPLIKIDTGLIDQVLQNILQNAIQYTPKNSVVNIHGKMNADQFELTITDNGPGFPENEIPWVFDKFYRLPNSKAGGTGLGLSIAKAVVEAHNGTIKLENEKPNGARFTITLPTETSFINNLKNE
jgi:two-component system sensor histidine kinase KdpD